MIKWFNMAVGGIFLIENIKDIIRIIWPGIVWGTLLFLYLKVTLG